VAEHAFPFATPPGDTAGQADWGSIFTALGAPGVILGQGNELAVTAPGGNQVSVATGVANSYGTAYVNDAPKTISTTANGGTSIRYDRVIVTFDYVANTAAASIVTGNNTNPPDLVNDRTNKVTISLAVLTVHPGDGTVSSGDVFQSLDRWAAPLNGPAVGSVVTYLGLLNMAPKNLLASYAQTVSRWNYEKLWAVMPSQGGSGTAPFHGRKNDGTNNIVMPDLRGRNVFGLDRMGQGNPFDAGRIDAADTLGQTFGSNAIENTDVAPHFHPLLPAGHTADETFHFGAGVGSFMALLYSGHQAPQGTDWKGFSAGDQTFRASTLDQMFTDLGLSMDGTQGPGVQDGAHTGFGPNETSPQSDDSKMNPGMLGFKLLRVA
jgi:hypothetical protein